MAPAMQGQDRAVGWRAALSALVVATLAVGLVACGTRVYLGPTPTATQSPTATPAAPTPAVLPTATAESSSIPAPAPPPTAAAAPLSTPTPAPDCSRIWEGLPDIESLDWEEADLAAVCALPWIADGIGAEEQDAARDVVLLAWRYGDVFRALAPKDWLDDGLDQAERDVLLTLHDLANEDEGLAQQIAAMPLWATLEPWSDITTLEVLHDLARDRPLLFDHASGQAWIVDGLTTPTERLLVRLFDEIQGEERIAVALEGFSALLGSPQMQDGLKPVEAELLRRVVEFKSDAALEAALKLIHGVLADSWVQSAQGFIDSNQRRLIRRLMWTGNGTTNTGPILLLDRPWIADGLNQAESHLLARYEWSPETDEELGGIKRLLDEPWVADGLNEVEDYLLLHIIGIPSNAEVRAISDLANVPWVADGLSKTEQSLFNSARYWRLSKEEIVAAISELLREPWVQDGLSEVEGIVIQRVGRMESKEIVKALSNAVVALSREAWVADGIDGDEFLIIRKIPSFGTTESLATARTALAEPWVADGIDGDERLIIRGIRSFDTRESLATVGALLAEPWVQDGLNEDERFALSDLNLSLGDPKAVSTLNALVRAPWFLNGLDETERAVVDNSRLDPGGAFDLGIYETLIAQPWVQDGLDEDERFALGRSWRFGDAGALGTLNALLKEPWFVDGLNETERFLMIFSRLRFGGVYDLGTFRTLLDQPWAQDGLDEDERDALGDLDWRAVDAEAISSLEAYLNAP